jgi:predicted ferric reductase
MVHAQSATQPQAHAHSQSRQYRDRLRRADWLQGIAWFSAVFAVAIYLADGGASDFTSWRDIPVGLGVIAGLLGSDLVLMMLLLAARLPVIDRAVGYDRAMNAHRRLGKPALYLLLAHFALVLVGYGIALSQNPLEMAVTMITSMEDMPLAFIGLGLILLVVISSLVIVRHHLPYQSWFVVHLLSYAAVLASIPHQFSQGHLFAEGTWARWYWLALYVAALGGVVVFRFLLPLSRNLRHRLVVTNVVPEAPGVVSILMTGRALEKLAVGGGQFFIWRFGQRGLRWEGHPYSLSDTPNGQSLRITVRDLGDSSRRLQGLRSGARVWAEGPYGLFTPAARTREDAVLIGGGIGITPIFALLADMVPVVRTVTVIVRADDDQHLYLRAQFEQVCAADHVELIEIVGPPQRDGHTWLPESARGTQMSLSTLVPNIQECDVFVCGPQRWTDFVIADARQAGVAASAIHTERFAW